MTTALVPYGLSVPRLLSWQTRRETHGPTGRKPPSTLCKRGHKRPTGTNCALCRAMRYGAERRRKLRARALKQAHPDTGGSSAKFRRVFRAYEAQT